MCSTVSQRFDNLCDNLEECFFSYDPANTCCVENDARDEYEAEAVEVCNELEKSFENGHTDDQIRSLVELTLRTTFDGHVNITQELLDECVKLYRFDVG